MRGQNSRQCYKASTTVKIRYPNSSKIKTKLCFVFLAINLSVNSCRMKKTISLRRYSRRIHATTAISEAQNKRITLISILLVIHRIIYHRIKIQPTTKILLTLTITQKQPRIIIILLQHNGTSSY